MRAIKSERLKKLEVELNDLEQWLKLGLVPKKDIKKHEEEIVSVKSKIEEEKERLQFLRESGETEEYVTPKRAPARAGYTEMPTIPDIDMGETGAGFNDSAFDNDSDMIDTSTSVIEERETEEEDHEGEDGTEQDNDEDTDKEEDESYFSDRNRWRRGGIVDPDADVW